MSPNAQEKLLELAETITKQANLMAKEFAGSPFQIPFEGIPTEGRTLTGTEALAQKTAESLREIAKAIRIIARDDCMAASSRRECSCRRSSRIRARRNRRREAREASDAICELELNLERMKLTALRLRAVALAAREFAPVGNPSTFNQFERELISALKDLDEHDAHHGTFVHIDGARRRGLATYCEARCKHGHDVHACKQCESKCRAYGWCRCER